MDIVRILSILILLTGTEKKLKQIKINKIKNKKYFLKKFKKM